jgi:hypothetical protein
LSAQRNESGTSAFRRAAYSNLSLSAQAKTFDQLAVTVDVNALQVTDQALALTN